MKLFKFVLLVLCFLLLINILNAHQTEMKVLKQDSLIITTIKQDTFKIRLPDTGLLLKESKNDSTKTK